ncbi:response regulator [Desulfobacula sp.]|uniref:response regulator n=1 Tax=Desulfobacula sp. TaxID=2593537 RepID=UPI002634ECA3|nr:response regulator [Desulfobacula sp.]
MPDDFDHTILIVDDEEPIGKLLTRMMKSLGARSVYVKSGQAALDIMETAVKPFSLILSDQRMPEMTGSIFLEKAKKISPDTIRFLITGYVALDAITDAVNKGAIHRYIIKPWDNKGLAETVKEGLEQYERVMEHHRLYTLAKKQIKKLYTLNMEFKERAAAHKETIIKKGKQISELNSLLETVLKNKNCVHEMEALLNERLLLDQGDLDSLYLAVIFQLYKQFQNIATLNDFEMPKTIIEDEMG